MVTQIELLDLLDRGEALAPPERALLLARAAQAAGAGGEPPGGGSGRVDVATLPLGTRDRMILELRSRLFGDVAEASDVCPYCGAVAVFQLSVAALTGPAPGSPPGDEDADGGDDPRAGGEPARVELRSGDLFVRCRLPTTADLLAAGRGAGPQEARQRLLEATVVEARQGSVVVAARALPSAMVEEIGRRLAEADPLAEIELATSCDTCGRSWQTALDVGPFVWQELRDWARRLQWEVHVLAGAYGWREQDVLAVPARRRQTYLELVAGG
jgi:hypothetical protein